MRETPDELRARAEDLRDHFTGDHCNCMSAEEAADTIDALLARLATAEALVAEARPLLVRYSETRDAALTDDQHRCEALLVSMHLLAARQEQP